MIKDLPGKLKQLRLQFNYSQSDVARLINVKPSTISGYETGERTPSVEVLLALSYLYKCSTDYLLGRETAAASVKLDTSGLTDEQIAALRVLIRTIKRGK